MNKLSQVTNPVPSQSIEDYYAHGPAKVENSDERFFQDQDTRFVMEFAKVKEKYNELRQQGSTHGSAWTSSKANTLPLEMQMLMKQEIEEKNPGFYVEEKAKVVLFSEAATQKMKGENFWNIVYSKEDIDRIAKQISSLPEKLSMRLSDCGLSKESIRSILMKH